GGVALGSVDPEQGDADLLAVQPDLDRVAVDDPDGPRGFPGTRAGGRGAAGRDALQLLGPHRGGGRVPPGGPSPIAGRPEDPVRAMVRNPQMWPSPVAASRAGIKRWAISIRPVTST